MNLRMNKRALLAVALGLLALPAMAHPGHADSANALAGMVSSFVAGLAHPLTGIDHVLAMAGVGGWSFQQRRPALALAFLVLMLAGALLHMALPLEAALAASVVLTGAMLAFQVRPPLLAALALVGGFAFLHGQAHGRELAGVASMAGYLLASGALLLAGWAAGAMTPAPNAGRIAGAAIGAGGLCLLAGIA